MAQLEHLDGLAKAPAWGDDLRDELRARLSDWTGLLGREPTIARQILRKLLVGRLVLTPTITDGGRFYRVQGQASYGRLLAGLLRGQAMVPPG